VLPYATRSFIPKPVGKMMLSDMLGVDVGRSVWGFLDVHLGRSQGEAWIEGALASAGARAPSPWAGWKGGQGATRGSDSDDWIAESWPQRSCNSVRAHPPQN
jgi:hypothetical protein